VLSNYRRLKEAIDAICELNQDPIPPRESLGGSDVIEMRRLLTSHLVDRLSPGDKLLK
jgi:hypothetical protein